MQAPRSSPSTSASRRLGTAAPRGCQLRARGRGRLKPDVPDSPAGTGVLRSPRSSSSPSRRCSCSPESARSSTSAPAGSPGSSTVLASSSRCSSAAAEQSTTGCRRDARPRPAHGPGQPGDLPVGAVGAADLRCGRAAVRGEPDRSAFRHCGSVAVHRLDDRNRGSGSRCSWSRPVSARARCASAPNCSSMRPMTETKLASTRSGPPLSPRLPQEIPSQCPQPPQPLPRSWTGCWCSKWCGSPKPPRSPPPS